FLDGYESNHFRELVRYHGRHDEFTAVLVRRDNSKVEGGRMMKKLFAFLLLASIPGNLFSGTMTETVGGTGTMLVQRAGTGSMATSNTGAAAGATFVTDSMTDTNSVNLTAHT